MNPMQIMQQFQRFKQQMLQQNPNINPQEAVQQLVQSGKVSQQQFENARNMLNMFPGAKI